MQIDTAGTYTLKYTAEDACGNVTEVTREVEVVQITYRTVLYTDGTFIINEKSTDQAANEALHGAATNVYDPFDPNGDTNVKKYIFSSQSQRPWDSQASSVKAVEIGSNIAPTSTRLWFSNFATCTSIDLDGLDTSAVTNMNSMFYYCRALTSLDLTHFNTSSVTNMVSMFGYCEALTSLDLTSFNTSNAMYMARMFNLCQALTSLDVSSFDTSSVTNMNSMFADCKALTSLDIANFDTSSVANMNSMFVNCQALTSLDVSSFDTSSVTDMGFMFSDCSLLTTIYASSAFTVAQVTTSEEMFADSTNLVGGAGTAWASSNPTDKTYARIDGGTSNPGYFTLKSA